MPVNDDAESRLAVLQRNLERLMQSGTAREARDAVAEDPLLLGPGVGEWLDESAKRLRQLGHVTEAEACEHWERVLRTFREFGLQHGYLELVFEQLFWAETPEQHRRIIRDNPNLTDDAVIRYLAQRFEESSAIADEVAIAKYTMVATKIGAAEIHSFSPDEQNVITEAVNTFMHDFINESNLVAQRRLLEKRPDLLQHPISMIVSSMFDPVIARARATNDIVTLHALLLRQALFVRCQAVGVAQAFQELEDGVPWEELDRA